VGVKIMHEMVIERKIRELPENLRKEIWDHVDFLLSKYQRRKATQKKLKFDWEGGLSDIKDKFTSVELQHKALGWR